MVGSAHPFAQPRDEPEVRECFTSAPVGFDTDAVTLGVTDFEIRSSFDPGNTTECVSWCVVRPVFISPGKIRAVKHHVVVTPGQEEIGKEKRTEDAKVALQGRL